MQRSGPYAARYDRIGYMVWLEAALGVSAVLNIAQAVLLIWRG